MKSLVELPVIRALHARNLLLPALVGVAVAAVLIHGALNRSESAEASVVESEPASRPDPTPTFRPGLEKTPLSYFADYWVQLGEHVQGRLIQVGFDEASAVVVSPGVALTSIPVADVVAQTQLSLSEQDQQGAKLRLLGVDVDFGVALLEMSQPYQAPAFSPTDPTTASPGSLVAAISLRQGGKLRVAPGYLVSRYHRDDPAGSFDVDVSTPGLRGAAAIVDLDGGLLGVAVAAESGRRLLSTEEVLALLDRIRSGEPCRAIEVGDLDAEAAKLLGVDRGVAIELVRKESFLPEPSLRPGDVLLDWNGEPVYGEGHFETLYDAMEPGALARYLVLRSGRRLRGGTVMPGRDCRPVGEPALALPQAGMTLRWTASGGDSPSAGWEVVSTVEGGPAAAILSSGDRIVAVGSASGDRGRMRRALEAFERRPQPLLMTFEHNGRAQLRVLAPPE